MSNYPESIDAFSPVTGSTEMTEHAERHTAEESSIVAIETALGTNPEGDADTVADRLDAQDTLIADNTQAISDLPEPNTYRLETDANTRSVPQIQLVDQDDEYSNVVFNAGDGISITSVGSGLNFAVDTDIIPDTTNFSTKTEVEEADAATLKAANDYTDEVQPDLATYATKTYVDDADAGLQQQIDQIEVYDDTDLTATVDSKFTMGGTWGELAGRA